MVAAIVGIVIVGVAFGLLDAVVRTTATSDTRIDVAQRGRLAIDTITQRLRSQVCGGTPAAQPVDRRRHTRTASSSGPTPATHGDAGCARSSTRASQIRWITYPGRQRHRHADQHRQSSRQRRARTTAPGSSSTSPTTRVAATSPSARLFTELGSTATLGAADFPKVVRITVAFTAYPEERRRRPTRTPPTSPVTSSRATRRRRTSSRAPSPTPKALEPRCR